jgi:hypothetical protein
MIMEETNLAFSLNFHSNISFNLHHIKFYFVFTCDITPRKYI